MRNWAISLGIGVVALLMALPPTASAHGGTELIVSGTTRAGGGIELTGEGFDANAVVRVELQRANDAPIEIGSVPTDEEGEWSATLHVPADARPGLYQVVAIGEDESASAEVTVLEAAAGSSPIGESPIAPSASNDRAAAETIGLLIFVAALGPSGAALLWPRGRPLRRSRS